MQSEPQFLGLLAAQAVLHVGWGERSDAQRLCGLRSLLGIAALTPQSTAFQADGGPFSSIMFPCGSYR
jgi:hypothetical protein